MKLWTLQPIEALQEIKERGAFRCERSKSFNLTKSDSLEKPYQWLIARMEERIGRMPEGVTYPIWGWHTWEHEHKRPDPDSAAFLKRTADKVLFTLEIPEDKVVLTDFELWQLLLIGTYVPAGKSEEALHEEVLWLDSLEGEALEEAIRASWENVFLPVPYKNLDRKYIQATFWQIEERDVLDYEVFRRAE